jgi:hypothetical protein
VHFLVALMIHSVYIIKDGLPLVVQQCSPQASKFAMDETRMTGLLAAMNTFCAELGGGVGEMQTLKTTANLQFSFVKRDHNDDALLFVACHDSDLPAENARRVLGRLASKFMAKYQSLNKFRGQMDAFADFSDELPHIVSDAVISPDLPSTAPVPKATGMPGLPPLPIIPDPAKGIEILHNRIAIDANTTMPAAPLLDYVPVVNRPDYDAIVPVMRATSLRPALAFCSGATAASILRCITGTASIAAIANAVGVSPDIVFRFCRNFMKYGMVGFTKEN